MSNTPVNGDPEKQAGLSFSEPHQDSGHQTHAQHARDRLQHFLHPNGTKIHVVESPQDEVNLRRRLEHAAEDDDEFDVCISGSEQHLEHLRTAHAHHTGRRDTFANEHPEMYSRFSAVHEELDALKHELDRVTSLGVSLSAHFSKYGYDAHIKTYDNESPPASGTTTPRSSVSGKGSEAKCEKGYGKPLKLFKIPVVRQYFHKGTLWRSSGAEEVQSFELFVDLLYVGIIAVNGDATSENPTAFSLLQFIITFTLSWKIWNDMSMLISWFETDDIFQRFSIIMLLAMLFGFTTNITHSFDDHGTWATLIGFYVAARLFMAIYLVLVAILVPMVRPMMIWHIAVALVGVAMWIGSIHVSYPNRLALIWTAPIVDICGQMIFIVIKHSARFFGQGFHDWMDKKFEFWPAMNIEHRTERMNAFVSLVFGYSVVSMLYQSTVNGVDAHYGKAVLGLTQAFCFNWMYFEIDGSNLLVHAIRRKIWTSFAWTISHLPFIMAFVLGSGGLSKLVLALDTPDSDPAGLAEASLEKAEVDIPQGIRWFYCAGYAVALAFMGFISMSHNHKESETLRLRKRWRLSGRFVVCIIMVFLPLADNLNSLQLVGIMTGLIVFALGTELLGASCCKEKLCQRSSNCKYFGHVNKKELEALVKNGTEVDVTQMGGKRRNNSGLAACNL